MKNAVNYTRRNTNTINPIHINSAFYFHNMQITLLRFGGLKCIPICHRLSETPYRLKVKHEIVPLGKAIQLLNSRFTE